MNLSILAHFKCLKSSDSLELSTPPSSVELAFRRRKRDWGQGGEGKYAKVSGRKRIQKWLARTFTYMIYCVSVSYFSSVHLCTSHIESHESLSFFSPVGKGSSLLIWIPIWISFSIAKLGQKICKHFRSSLNHQFCLTINLQFVRGNLSQVVRVRLKLCKKTRWKKLPIEQMFGKIYILPNRPNLHVMAFSWTPKDSMPNFLLITFSSLSNYPDNSL